jgi:archaemetzincin
MRISLRSAQRCFVFALLMLILNGPDPCCGKEEGTRPKGAKPSVSGKISLVCYGEVDSGILEYLKENLAPEFRASCETSGPLPIPAGAYDAKRRQYRSTVFLEDLSGKYGRKAGYVLGITAVDLFVPTLNFVFGEADKDGAVAVISTVRLRPEFYGRPADCALYRERALKEAVHELGHVHGLPHCRNPRCVMHFSNSIDDTDFKSARFCRVCAQEIGLPQEPEGLRREPPSAGLKTSRGHLE